MNIKAQAVVIMFTAAIFAVSAFGDCSPSPKASPPPPWGSSEFRDSVYSVEDLAFFPCEAGGPDERTVRLAWTDPATRDNFPRLWACPPGGGGWVPVGPLKLDDLADVELDFDPPQVNRALLWFEAGRWQESRVRACLEDQTDCALSAPLSPDQFGLEYLTGEDGFAQLLAAGYRSHVVSYPVRSSLPAQCSASPYQEEVALAGERYVCVATDTWAKLVTEAMP